MVANPRMLPNSSTPEHADVVGRNSKAARWRFVSAREHFAQNAAQIKGGDGRFLETAFAIEKDPYQSLI